MCRVLVANAPVHSGREPVPDPELDIVCGAEQTEGAIREWELGRSEEEKEKKETS